MRLLIAVSIVGASLLFLASAVDAGATLRITALDCGSHPRRVRIENQGDAAQDLAGWQLRSDAVEGTPWTMTEVGSIAAGGKFFVFQGHLSPAVNPSLGYYRWGTDEIFNLRANDSSDFVRIVDGQGNTVDQRNCEGLPPGATPAPTTEFDPPSLATPVVTPTAAAPAATAAVGASVTARTTLKATPRATGVGQGQGLPQGGGAPPAGDDATATLALGAVLLTAGAVSFTLGFERSRRRR